MRNLLLTTLLLGFLSSNLWAQSLALKEYQARFERRPLLEIDPSLLLYRFPSGQFIFIWDLDFRWQSRINTNEVVQNITTSFLPRGIHRFGSVDVNDLTLDISTIQFFDWEKLWYRKPGRFGGMRTSLNNEILFKSFRFQSEKTFYLHTMASDIALEIFGGRGRIEFAEDALLANWIADDLVAADLAPNINAEQRTVIAQAITRTIGNRTFDFRRRRIYELEQLFAAMESANIPVQDTFRVAAIINDNWAFANRGVLSHGNRRLGGLTINSRHTMVNNPNNIAAHQILPGVGIFGEYRYANIVGKQGAWSIFGRLDIGILGRYLWLRRELEIPESQDAFRATLGIDYTYFLNSRSLIQLQSSTIVPIPLSLNTRFIDNGLVWQNSLTIQHFINYRCQLSCQLTINGDRNWESGRTFWAPGLFVSSQIALF